MAKKKTTKKRCDCSKCKGRLRSRTTIKNHRLNETFERALQEVNRQNNNTLQSSSSRENENLLPPRPDFDEESRESTPTLTPIRTNNRLSNSWRDSAQTPITIEDVQELQRMNDQMQEQLSEIRSLLFSSRQQDDSDDESEEGEGEGEGDEDEDEDEEDGDDEDDERQGGGEENRINNQPQGEENTNQMQIDDGNDDGSEEPCQGSQEPLYEGAKVTVEETAYYLLNWKKDHNCTFSSMNELLGILKSMILPKDNLLPQTFNALEKILGLKDPNIYSIHVCVNDCKRFEKLKPDQWKDHLDEICEKCKELRFSINQANGSVTPRKKFMPLPVVPQLLKMSNTPEYIQSYQKMEEEKKGKSCFESFWGGTLARLLQETGQPLEKFFESCAFCIGIDGVQYDNSHVPKSVYIIGLKNWSLDPTVRTKDKFIILYAIIPGPKAPKNFITYLEPLFQEISSFFNGKLVSKFLGKEKILLKIVVVTTELDHHCRCECSEYANIGAFFCCHYCWQKGEHNDKGKGMFMLGYNEPDARKRTDAETRELSQHVTGPQSIKETGITKVGAFQMFPNYDTVNGYIINHFHNAFEVIPTNFFRRVIFPDYKGEKPPGAMPKTNRKVFQYRVSRLIRSHEMKKIIDISKYKLRADEAKDFIIFASLYLLEGLVEEHIMQMAVYYRRYIIALYQDSPNEANLKEGLRCLKEFAKIAQEKRYFPVLTIGLHIETCETENNVLATGPPKENLGAWVERLVGMMVKITDHRVSQKPEITMTREYLLNRHLDAISHKFLSLKTVNLNLNENFWRDDGFHNIKFLGNGKLKPLDSLDKESIELMIAGYDLNLPELPNVYIEFQQLQIGNSIFHSRSYSRTKVSNSTGFEMIHNNVSHYGQITRFLLLPTNIKLRVAEVIFFHPKHSTEWGVPRVQKNSYDPEMILVETINSKIVLQDRNAGDSYYSVLFTPSYSSSFN